MSRLLCFARRLLLVSLAVILSTPAASTAQFISADPAALRTVAAQPAAQAPTGSSVRLRLTGQTPVVNDLGIFDFRVDVRDPEAQPDLDLAIAVYQRVTERSALLDSINGLRLGSPVALRVRPLGTPGPNGTHIISERLIVGSCSDCLSIPTDGVYPISVDLRERSDGSVAARLITHMIVQRNASPTLDVALVLPAIVRRTLQPDGTHRSASLGHLVAVGESLASQRDTPLSVIPTPAVADLAAQDIAVSGALDTLATGLRGRELVSSPYETVHPALQQDGRLSEVMAGQWRAGTAALTRRFGEVVVDDVWIVGPTDRMPDRDGLLKIAPQRLVVHSSLVAELDDTGRGAVPRLQTAPVAFDTGLEFSRRADGTLDQQEVTEESSAISALVSDETLTEHLRNSDALLGVSHFLADLAIASERTTAGAGIVAFVPDAALQRLTLDALLAGVSSLRSVEPVRVTQLFEQPIATDDAGDLRVIGRVGGADTDSSNTYLDYLADVDSARRSIDGVNLTFFNSNIGADAERFFSAALSDPDAGTPTQGSTDPILAGRDFLEGSSQLAIRRLAGVRLAAGGPFRLTALRGRIPVTIENLTGGPAQVHLSVAQGRVRSTPESAEQDVIVQPGSQVVLLDVETRSSGSFDVRVAIATPNGVALSEVGYTIRSTGVSGVGVTLTLTLLGLLMLWWLSNRAKAPERRGLRRRSRSQPSPGSSTDGN